MNFNLKISDHGSRDVRHGEDRWDYDWSEDHSYDYDCATIVTEGYSDVSLFPGEAAVKLGDDIYIVYVSYDTGDSFGREYGRREHLWAFSDPYRARGLAAAIAADAQADPDYDFDHKPLEFEGVPINTNTWKGYFEHFNSAGVETLVVKRNKR